MFDLQRQWDNVGGVKWLNRYDSLDVEQFWTNVFLYTDAAGERVFYTLATFALSLLALPFSNASVERCFSQMNIIKCKLRNRMKQPMLEAIMHVRGYMSRHHICCNKFEVSQCMLSRFNKHIYDDRQENVLPDDF